MNKYKSMGDKKSSSKKKYSGSKTSKKKVDPGKILKKPEEYAPKGTEAYDKTKTQLYTINSDPVLFEKKMKEMIDNGRKIIHSKEELQRYPLGTLVSYVTNSGLYRSGGFLKSLQDEYFTLQGGTFAMPISFPVQYKNIQEMYVGVPIRLLNRNKDKKTKFKVKLGKKTVYYAKDNYDVKRFMKTKRYKDMAAWHELYAD